MSDRLGFLETHGRAIEGCESLPDILSSMHPRIPFFQEIRLLGTDTSTDSTKEGRIECSLVDVWIIGGAWKNYVVKGSVIVKERVFVSLGPANGCRLRHQRSLGSSIDIIIVAYSLT